MWTTVITGVISIVGLLLKWWLDSSPAKKQEAADDKTMQGRADVAVGDVAAVESRLDSVFRADGGSNAGSDSHPGEPGAGVQAIEQRLAAFGLGPPETH